MTYATYMKHRIAVVTHCECCGHIVPDLSVVEHPTTSIERKDYNNHHEWHCPGQIKRLERTRT